MKTSLRLLIPTGLLLALASPAPAQQPSIQERVSALKASLAASKAILKKYEWVETIVVSHKGEEKSRQMNRCYYGVDGKEQKIPITTPPPEERRRGLRGRIEEKEQEKMTDYIKSAVALVKQYIPPDEAKIQAAREAGNVSLTPLPDQRMRLTFANYLKPNDSLALVVNLANNRPLEAKVSSYLDSEKDPVSLDVVFGTLENSATYPSSITLEAKRKELKLSVQNSGYRLQTP